MRVLPGQVLFLLIPRQLPFLKSPMTRHQKLAGSRHIATLYRITKFVKQFRNSPKYVGSSSYDLLNSTSCLLFFIAQDPNTTIHGMPPRLLCIEKKIHDFTVPTFISVSISHIHATPSFCSSATNHFSTQRKTGL